MEAKKAAMNGGSQMSGLPPLLEADPLPHSLATARQAFRAETKQRWGLQWRMSPRYTRLSKIDNRLPQGDYLSDTAKLTRAQSSLITQLRTGHVPLNKHLHRIKRAPSPLCPACTRADESTHHFLFECRTYEHARHVLRRKLGRKSTSVRELLGKPEPMLALLRYVAATGRLKGTFGDVSPPPD
jgi:hypothetical protein